MTTSNHTRDDARDSASSDDALYWQNWARLAVARAFPDVFPAPADSVPAAATAPSGAGREESGSGSEWTPSARAAEALADLLGSEAAHLREAAAILLGASDPAALLPAVPSLRRRIQRALDDDPEDFGDADVDDDEDDDYDADLGNFNGAGSSAVAADAARLDGVCRAIAALARIAGTAALPLLLRCLKGHSDAPVDLQWAAADALGSLGDVRAIPALVREMNGDGLVLPCRAARALGRIGTPPARAALESVIARRPRSASQYDGHFGAPDADGNRESDVVAVAKEALAALFERAALRELST